MNDDFAILSNYEKNNYNVISPYVHNLYKERKLLNSSLITKRLYEWVDNIFGENQLPKGKKAAESCNVFNKLSYEKYINFEEKIKKYYNLLQNNEIKEKIFFEKMRGKIDMAVINMNLKKLLKIN